MIEPPERFGKYLLLERIAIGGMAEIFKAKTEGMGGFEKSLVIKRLHAKYGEDDDFVRMLIDEARIAVRLSHMNIAQVYDLGQVGDQVYIAMELVEGRDLYQVLKRQADLGVLMPLEAAVFLAIELCSGLDYAHRQTDSKGRPLGIVHRDISPQNALVSWEGEVKIVDFGIAKATMQSQETRSGTIKGKFYYMSPEQAKGDTVDQRTDIFSIGIVLYELLTGTVMYSAEDDAALLAMARRAEIDPPTTLRSDIPLELERIVMKALSRDRDRRYQSAHKLRMALMSFLHAYGRPYSRVQLSAYMRDLFEKEQIYGDLDVSLDYHNSSDQVFNRADFDAEFAGFDTSLLADPTYSSGVLPSPLAHSSGVLPSPMAHQSAAHASPIAHQSAAHAAPYDPMAEGVLHFGDEAGDASIDAGWDEFEEAPTSIYRGPRPSASSPPSATEVAAAPPIDPTNVSPAPFPAPGAAPPPLPPMASAGGPPPMPPHVSGARNTPYASGARPAPPMPPRPAAPPVPPPPEPRMPAGAVPVEQVRGGGTKDKLHAIQQLPEEDRVRTGVYRETTNVTARDAVQGVPPPPSGAMGGLMAMADDKRGRLTLGLAVLVALLVLVGSLILISTLSDDEADAPRAVATGPEGDGAAGGSAETNAGEAEPNAGGAEAAAAASLRVTLDGVKSATFLLGEESQAGSFAHFKGLKGGQTYTLKVNAKGFDPDVREVAVPKEGGDVDLKVAFGAKTFAVKLTTTPEGATVRRGAAKLDGTTPMTIEALPTGAPVELTVEREGYTSETVKVTFASGDASPKPVEVTLKKAEPVAVKDDAAKDAAAKDDPKAETPKAAGRETVAERRKRLREERRKKEEARRARAEEAAKKAKASPASFGFISVNARPWGQVYIDGRRVARETPLHRYKVKSGQHTVKVVFPSLGGKSRQRSIVVQSGQNASVFLKP